MVCPRTGKAVDIVDFRRRIEAEEELKHFKVTRFMGLGSVNDISRLSITTSTNSNLRTIASLSDRQPGVKITMVIHKAALINATFHITLE